MTNQENSFRAKSDGSCKLLVIGLWDSTVSLLARVASKLRPEPTDARVAPLARPKKLLTTISNKTIRFGRQKRPTRGELEMDGCDDGEFGLWQKSILMGEKCEPLDFPGVIYYDRNGKQLDELPVRSPRASPLPGYLCDSAARREKGF